MRSRRFVEAAIAIVICALAAACFGPRTDPTERRYFAFDVSRPGALELPVDGWVLHVTRVRVAAPFRATNFVYRRGDATFHSDFHNEFFAPPGTLITEVVKEWFSGSGPRYQVIDSDSIGKATHTLEGRVSELYGDFTEDGPRAVLALRLTLLRNTSRGTEPLFHDQYRAEVRLEGDAPEDLAQAWSAALEQVLKRFESDLQEVSL